ncbi:MAG: hypothetical protein NVS1B11_19840 [Terriglobales bacterium]
MRVRMLAASMSYRACQIAKVLAYIIGKQELDTRPHICQRAAVQELGAMFVHRVLLAAFTEEPVHHQESAQNPRATLGNIAMACHRLGARMARADRRKYKGSVPGCAALVGMGVTTMM